MIAQIKIVANAKELNAYNEAKQQNELLPKENQIEIPVVEPEYVEKLVGFDLKNVTMAYENGEGGITIEHLGKTYSILHTPDSWNKIQQRFK